MLDFLRRAIAKPSEPGHIDLIVAGETLRVTIKKAAAARRFTLRVRAATRDVVLTMPARGSMAKAREFAQRHADWLETRLTRLPQGVPLLPGSIIPVRGVDHLIVHRPAARRIVWIEAATNQDMSSPGVHLCVSGEMAHVPRRLADYLKKEARRDLESAVAHHSRQIAKPVLKITLRDTTSRWGSCSSRGSLNFSWRLILAPAYVLDYLAAHEVAHLVHMDHSAAFWKLAGTLAPEMPKAEAWLKLHGTSLHRYGA